MLITVIIPYFNDGLYIDEAVDSILNQTYKNVEIIIVNDGSTDEFSINKIKKYDKPKTTVIHQENKGGAAARNTGFYHANTEFVLTLDGDDMFEHTFIEKALPKLIENSEIAAVSAWAKGFGEKEFIWKLSGGSIDNFIYSNQSVACALIRKSAWQSAGGYKEQLRNNYEDWDFWISVTKNNWNIYVIPEPLFLYRQKTASMVIETVKNHEFHYTQLMLRHSDIYLSHILEQRNKNAEYITSLEEEKRLILSSLSYRLGHALLQPLRWLRKIAQ